MRYQKWALIFLAALALGGCSRAFYGGAAVGAGTAAIAYEVYNEEAMDEIEDDYEDGDISKEEYERRKDEIEDRSVVQ